jgi:hypothetical protein
MKLASTISGLLLVVGGISGVVNLFNPLGMVLSVYNIMFGVLILLTELKSWPIIKTIQKRIDVYFHLLSVPRGKGAFYCFIGVLAFFASDWSLSKICVLIVAIVGFLHLFSKTPVPSPEDALQPSVAAESSSWSSLAMEVAKDNPGMVNAAIDSLSRNPQIAQQAAQRAMTGTVSGTMTSGGAGV